MYEVGGSKFLKNLEDTDKVSLAALKLISLRYCTYFHAIGDGQSELIQIKANDSWNKLISKSLYNCFNNYD